LNPDEVVADSSFEKMQNGSKVNVVQPTGQRSQQQQQQPQNAPQGGQPEKKTP